MFYLYLCSSHSNKQKKANQHRKDLCPPVAGWLLFKIGVRYYFKAGGLFILHTSFEVYLLFKSVLNHFESQFKHIPTITAKPIISQTAGVNVFDLTSFKRLFHSCSERSKFRCCAIIVC